MNSLCQLPPPLKPGDLLQVVAPSGCLRDPQSLRQGIEIWRSWGYRVEIDLLSETRWGYLAAPDRDRRQQLLTALKDPDCRGILCARGGYGAMRLLEDWTWPVPDPSDPQLSQTGKWLIGFSDITALLWSYCKQGISGVHGPLLTSLKDEPDWSIQRLFDWVAGRLLPPLQGQGWGGGQATGPLLPANLCIATHLLQTSHCPNLSGAILALEEIGEAPYRLDRMLTQWRLSGQLEHISGIALGRFSQCNPLPNQSSLTVEEVLRDRISDLGIPIISDLPFGHDGPNATLPVGLSVTLDADSGRLDFCSKNYP